MSLSIQPLFDTMVLASPSFSSFSREGCPGVRSVLSAHARWSFMPACMKNTVDFGTCDWEIIRW